MEGWIYKLRIFEKFTLERVKLLLFGYVIRVKEYQNYGNLTPPVLWMCFGFLKKKDGTDRRILCSVLVINFYFFFLTFFLVLSNFNCFSSCSSFSTFNSLFFISMECWVGMIVGGTWIDTRLTKNSLMFMSVLMKIANLINCWRVVAMKVACDRNIEHILELQEVFTNSFSSNFYVFKKIQVWGFQNFSCGFFLFIFKKKLNLVSLNIAKFLQVHLSVSLLNL